MLKRIKLEDKNNGGIFYYSGGFFNGNRLERAIFVSSKSILGGLRFTNRVSLNKCFSLLRKQYKNSHWLSVVDFW